MSAPGLDLSVVRAPACSDDSAAQNRLGAIFQTDDGREYKYYRANEAIAIGQIVVFLNNDNADVDAAASDNTMTGTGDFTAAEFDDLDYYVFIDADGVGATEGQVRRILSNTANILTLDASWTTAVSTDSDYVTFSPHNVELADAANERVVGVAISAISSGQYGWFQIRGFCPQVRAEGGTDALVLHEGVVSSGTAGTCKGLTAAGTTADEADKAFGFALSPSAMTDAAGTGAPIMLKCAV